MDLFFVLLGIIFLVLLSLIFSVLKGILMYLKWMHEDMFDNDENNT